MSGRQVRLQQPSYFGKLPSRGDFLKGQYNPQLLKVLDEWLAQGLELLAEDPGDWRPASRDIARITKDGKAVHA